jgi:hypothetical protein
MVVLQGLLSVNLLFYLFYLPYQNFLCNIDFLDFVFTMSQF